MNPRNSSVNLNLKIPNLAEISSSNKKEFKPERSLIKNTSPKRKESSFQSLPSSKKKALDRITDINSLKRETLPRFLTTSIELSKSLSPRSKNPKILFTQSIDCPTDSSSIPGAEIQVKCQKLIPQDQVEFVSCLKSMIGPEETLAIFKKKQLKRKELQCLVSNSIVECNVIDTFLLIFKYINRNRFRKNECFDRVYVIETVYSVEVFLEGVYKFELKRNPLKYEFVLFPVFIKTWMLVVLDTRYLKLRIFAYRITNKSVSLIVEKIKAFISIELFRHETKYFEMTNWVHMSHDVVEIQCSNKAESGVEILKEAYKLAVGNQCEGLYSNAEFKNHLITLLFKHGNPQPTCYK